jgi:prepilin peptidase CpaA
MTLMLALADVSLDTLTAPPAWVWLLLLVATGTATVTDLRTMRIPNWLTLPLFALGVSYWGTTAGLSGLTNSLLGALVAGGIFIGAYILAGGGAGDAKLMLALGSWVGLEPSVVVVLGVTFAGFLWSVLLIIRRQGVGSVPLMLLHGLVMTRLEFRKVLRSGVTTVEAPAMDQPLQRPEQWMPYAPAIFVGTAAGWWYWSIYGSVV